MKPKAKKEIKRNKIYLHKRTRRGLRSKRKSKTKRKHENWIPPTKDFPHKVIKFPELLSILNSDTRPKILSAISKINEYCTNGHTIYLDLSQVKTPRPDGVIYLKANLDNINSSIPKVNIRLIKPKDRKLMAVFKQIGLLEILGIDYTIDHQYKDVINWRHTSGESVIGEEFENLCDESRTLPQITRKKLYAGFTEAMTNVIGHAYLEEKNKKWWAFSHHSKKSYTLCFCDLGIGIKHSLSRKDSGTFFERFKEYYEHEGKLIERVVKTRRTGSGNKKYRGHGMKKFLPELLKVEGAQLNIISSYGEFSETFIKPKEIKKISHNKESINGTIIWWTIPVIDLA